MRVRALLVSLMLACGSSRTQTAPPAPAGPWQRASDGLPAGDVAELVAAGTGQLYALVRLGTGLADEALYRSTDGARSWTRAHAEDRLPVALSGLATDGTASGRLYALDGTGVRRSDDAGASWTATAALDATARALAVSPAGEVYAFATVSSDASPSATAVLHRSVDRGASWAEVHRWTGAAAAVDAIAGALAVVYLPPSAAPAAALSTDGGVAWSESAFDVALPAFFWQWGAPVFVRLASAAPPSAYVGFHVYQHGVSHTPPDSVYAFLQRIDGTAWTSVSPLPPGTVPRDGSWASLDALAAIPGTPVVYASALRCPGEPCSGAGASLKRSSDAGASWVDLVAPAWQLHALVVDPAAPDTLYAATSDGVFKSTTGGR